MKNKGKAGKGSSSRQQEKVAEAKKLSSEDQESQEELVSEEAGDSEQLEGLVSSDMEGLDGSDDDAGEGGDDDDGPGILGEMDEDEESEEDGEAGSDDDGTGILGEMDEDEEPEEDREARSDDYDMMGDDDILDLDADDDDDNDEKDGEKDSSDDESDDSEPAGGAAKFTEGAKGASFAKAFAKILEQKIKRKAVEQEEEAAAAILADSKTVQKLAEEEEEVTAANRAAKKLRIELKRRGHVSVSRRGENPDHDVREKQLMRLATRGVVLLFNAVNKAQKAAKSVDGGPGGPKPVKMSKASFLAQLKAPEAGAEAATKPGGVLTQPSKKAKPQAVARESAPGWKVLQAGYTGLEGGKKMKDWDKQANDSDSQQEQLVANEEDISDDGDGW